MFDLFGSEMPLPAKFFIAFAAVLALIALTAWVVRKFAADRLGGSNARGRQPRLAVIDAATVDARRRLVLIRRDNVEHLMMIGGPTDVVVEQNIVRAAPAAPRAPEPPARPAEHGLRQTPALDTGFPLQPVTESAPLPPPRPYRAPATEEPWHAPEPGARPRPASSESSLSGLAAELSGRLTPPEMAPRHEAPRMAAPQAAPHVAPQVAPAPPQADFEPGTAPQSDHNLAEMAQQLEAALRRAPATESRAPVTDPLAAQVAPPVPPKPVEMPRREYKLRVDPRFDSAADKNEARPETKVEPKIEPKLDAKFGAAFDAKFEPRLEPSLAPAKSEPPLKPELPRSERPAAAAKPAPAGKSVYDSLEEEMASLLGRPPGKT